MADRTRGQGARRTATPPSGGIPQKDLGIFGGRALAPWRRWAGSRCSPGWRAPHAHCKASKCNVPKHQRPWLSWEEQSVGSRGRGFESGSAPFFQDAHCCIRHVPLAALGAPRRVPWRTAHWKKRAVRASESPATWRSLQGAPAEAPVRRGGNGETPTGRNRTAQRPRDGGRRNAHRFTENGGRAPSRWSRLQPGMEGPAATRGRSSTRDATHPRSWSHLVQGESLLLATENPATPAGSPATRHQRTAGAQT